MDRLSDWRAAAWLAFCLAALAAAAALIVSAASRHPSAPAPDPAPRGTLAPRTYLFGQEVTATLDVPAGSRVQAAFAPFRVVSRTVARIARSDEYRYRLDCLESRCVGTPGAEEALGLPPVRIVLPSGRKLAGSWPQLRQASRLGPDDLSAPHLRGDLLAPARPARSRGLAGATLLALGAAAALAGAAALGFRWLGWRPLPRRPSNGRRTLSSLEYALVVTGLAAGGGQENRRTALESLAIALEERGLGDLAARARSIAWSPGPPAGERVRQLAADVQRVAKGAG